MTIEKNGSFALVGGGGSPMEQFVLLAKSAKGAAAASLVEQAVAAPGLYVFGELLACPSIKSLADVDQTRPYWDLLNLFAFCTFAEYLQSRDKLPKLSDPMLLKLRQLTIVSIASRCRRIPYADLQTVLGMSNVRELEDMIIDSIYKGFIQGKLDQQRQCVEIEYCKGRDVRPEDVPNMSHVLAEWTNRCQAVLISLEEQIREADSKKKAALDEQKRVDDEFANLKKTIKVAAGGAEMEEGSIPGEVTSSRMPEPPERKKEKTRHKQGLRGSSNASRPKN